MMMLMHTSEATLPRAKKASTLRQMISHYKQLEKIFNEPQNATKETSKQVIRVLHLEDGMPERFFVRELLRRKPGRNTVFEVTHATRMFDALTALEHHLFDLILADLQLPDTAGLETVMALRAAAPDVPIILHSGVMDPDLFKDAAKLCGIRHYIMKGMEDPETFHILLRDTILTSERK